MKKSIQTSLLLVVAMATFLLAPALAAAAPNITLTESTGGTVLYGNQSSVTLTAANPAGQPWGYNLSFRDVLPANTSYVSGSGTFLGQAAAPQIMANEPIAGETTLIWSNLADLSPNSSSSLSYKVSHDTDFFNIGDTYTENAGAYVNTDARNVPKFDNVTGVPVSSSYTGSDAASANTTISAIKVTQNEGSAEGEIMKGLHDNQRAYTLKVINNSVNPTDGIEIDDWLPANMEFLGCGSEDNTTDVPTNPGSKQEYPGSGSIDPGNAPGGLTNCQAPSKVETVDITAADPDVPACVPPSSWSSGDTADIPCGVYTHVVWNDVADLAIDGSYTMQFVAAAPLHENTMTWSGAMPTPASGEQAANLDNNSGPISADEDDIPNYAAAAGLYNGTQDVSDHDTMNRTIEDLAIQKSASSGSIAQGSLTTYHLHLETGEYVSEEAVSVVDTLPDGQCPIGPTDYQIDPTGECAPTGNEPSDAYTSVTDNTDGSYTIKWDQSTVPALGEIAADSTYDITFPAMTQTHYQADHAPTTPVLSSDSWSNNATTSATPQAACITCGAAHSPETDASSAGQSAPGPTLASLVRQPQVGTVDCDTGTYISTTATSYGPGDKVCWKVRVSFRDALNTLDSVLTDFMPPNTTYVPGSAHTTASSTATVANLDSSIAGQLTWTLGDSGYVQPGQVFEAVFATTIDSDPTSFTGDLKENLVKFNSSNTAGQSFPLRTQADFEYTDASLTLTKGVASVNGTATSGPNVDGTQVTGGDTVTYRIDLTNAGGSQADDTEVWDVLPAGSTCSDFVGASDGGTCDSSNKRVVWTGITVPANDGTSDGSKKLTVTFNWPNTYSPSQSVINEAGVRTYTSTDNDGGNYRYIPTDDIDPDAAATFGVPVNAVAADDTSNVVMPALTSSLVRHTSITEAGNTDAQATIGEGVTYMTTLVIPQGTTVYPSTSLVFTLGTNQTFVSASGSVDGTPTSPVISGSTYTLAASNTLTAASGPISVSETVSATVADATALNRSSSISGSASYSYVDQTAGKKSGTTSPASISTTIVNPLISVSKSNNTTGNKAVPGQNIAYTVTAKNSNTTNVSTAHSVVVTDVVPAGLTPVNGTTPIVDGGSVSPDGGTWNAATRTITWTSAAVGGLNAMAPNASVPLHYNVLVDNPATSGTTFINNAKDTATSLAGGLGRTSASTNSTGFVATTSNTVNLNDISFTKSATPSNTTIGQPFRYTIDMTLPGNVQYYDLMALDKLPDGVAYDGSPSITCLAGCNLDQTPVTLPTVANADGTTSIGFWFGDLTDLSATRVVEITFDAHLEDTYHGGSKVLSSQTLVNTVKGYDDLTDKISGTPSSIPNTTTPAPNGVFDSQPGNASSSETVIEPALVITKSSAPNGSVQAGTHFTYTLHISNTGPDNAYDVTLGDKPSAFLTDVTTSAGISTSANTDPWTAADPTMQWQIPEIDSGTSVDLTYTADLVSSTGLHDSAKISNTATIPTYYGQPEAVRDANPTFTFRSYSATPSTVSDTLVLPQPHLVKTTGVSGNPSVADAEVGQSFPWRIVVSNQAATTADFDNPVVVDTLPDNWKYDAGSAKLNGTSIPDPQESSDGTTLTWGSGLPDVSAGGSFVITYTATPSLAAKSDPGVGSGHPNVNAAVVTGEDADGNAGSADGAYTADGSASAILTTPNLVVTKTPDGADVTAGTSSNFKIQIQNSGDGTARNVQVSDVLDDTAVYTPGSATDTGPTGTTFSEGAITDDGNQTTVPWTISSIAPGATVTITMPVAVPAGVPMNTTINNKATATATEDPTPKFDSGSMKVVTSADLLIEKTAPAEAVPGEGTIDYTLKVTNNGPSTARDVTTSDKLPDSVSYVSSDSGCSYDSGTSTVTCSLGDIPTTASVSKQITVSIDPAQTAVINNTATVTSDTSDPDPSNNSSTASTSMNPETDLALTKAPDSGTVNQTETDGYTLEVLNSGPSVARNVVVTDPVPSGETFANSTDCTEAAGMITCDLGDIAPNSTHSAHIVMNITGSGAINNTATVTTDTTQGPGSGPTTAMAQIQSTPVADLQITKTGPVDADAEQVAFNLHVVNNGPSDDTGVTVVDQLPSHTSFDASSSDSRCALQGGEIVCAVGALNNQAATDLNITLDVDSVYAEQTLSNTAEVSGDLLDLDTGNNTSTANVPINADADLAITKTAPATYPAQSRLVYDLEVDNNGPSNATGVVVTDPLPAGTSFDATDSDSRCSAAANTVSCALGALAVTGKDQFHIAVNVPLGLAEAHLSNTATVSGDQFDGDHSDNSSTAETDINPAADLSIDKTAAASMDAPGDLVYTIAYSNSGPSDAANVSITDPLPAGTTFVSADSPCAFDAAGDTVSCDLGTVADGGSGSVQITVHVPVGSANTTISNTATIDSDTEDPNGGGSSTAVTVVDPAADLLTTKVSGSPDGLLGQHGVWTVTVTNNGPNTAASSQLVDTLPSGVTLDQVPAGCTYNAPEISCAIGDMDNGDVYQIKVGVTFDQVGVEDNVAHASSSTHDPNPADNTAHSEINVHPATDLELHKTAAAGIGVNGDLTYTLQATDNGPSDATGVSISDPLPQGTIFEAEASDSSCSSAAGVVRCSVGDLPAGSSKELHVVVKIDPSLADQTIVNTATISGDQGDPVPENNAASASTTVRPAADLQITKTAAPVAAGGDLVYTLIVANHGPNTAKSVHVSDPLPADTSFREVRTSSGSCQMNGSTLDCGLGDMVSGADVQIILDVRVGEDASGASISNTATVSSDTDDPVSSNNTSTAVVTVDPENQRHFHLTVSKQLLTRHIVLGSPAEYLITVTNLGPDQATDVILTDTADASIKVVRAKPSQGSCKVKSQVTTCLLGTIEPGQKAQVHTKIIPHNLSKLTNTASVKAFGQDTDPDGNFDKVSSHVLAARSAVLSLVKKASKKTVTPGGTVAYTIIAKVKQAPVANLKVCDKLPAGLSYISYRGAKLIHGSACRLIEYAKPGTYKLHIKAKISEDAQGKITNKAVLQAAGEHKKTATATVNVDHVAPKDDNGGVTG